MVVTNDGALAEKVDVLRRHGSPKKYHAEVLGYNSRLDALQAAILRVKLGHLDAWNGRRRELARRYDMLLADLPVTTPPVAPGVEHAYHQYTIRVRERDALAAHLRAQGVGTMIYYPVPLHLQGLYTDLGYGAGALPVSEQASREVLSLPIYPQLGEEQQSEVVGAIGAFYRGSV
jgi:dTDP-4-amino-4,6-dideoxygalactose transaminase